MRRLRVPFTIGLLVAFASGGSVRAQGRTSPGALTGQDYAEIHQLYRATPRAPISGMPRCGSTCSRRTVFSAHFQPGPAARCESRRVQGS